MPQMSVAEYAKHRGCNTRAVVTALQAGRIRRNENGWIDSEQADRDWAANTNPRRSDAARKNGYTAAAIRKLRVEAMAKQRAAGTSAAEIRDPAAKLSAEEVAGGGSGSSSNPSLIGIEEAGAFTRARAVRERFAALLMKATYEERSGRMVDRAEIQTAVFNWNRMIRDGLMAIPDRVAAQLAAESDAAACHALLEAELRTVLDRMSQMQTLQASRRRGQNVSFG